MPASRFAPASPVTPAAPAPKKLQDVELRGRVLSAKGEPVPLAPVEIFAFDWELKLSRQRVVADEEGRFQARIPGLDRCTMTTHLPGHGRAFLPVDASSSTPGELPLTLRTPYDFDARLEDAGGAPVAGATLRFHPISVNALDAEGRPIELNLLGSADAGWAERCRRELFLTDAEVRSDERGGFRAPSIVGSFNYSVEVIREGRQTLRLDVLPRAAQGKVRLPADR